MPLQAHQGAGRLQQATRNSTTPTPYVGSGLARRHSRLRQKQTAHNSFSHSRPARRGLPVQVDRLIHPTLPSFCCGATPQPIARAGDVPSGGCMSARYPCEVTSPKRNKDSAPAASATLVHLCRRHSSSSTAPARQRSGPARSTPSRRLRKRCNVTACRWCRSCGPRSLPNSATAPPCMTPTRSQKSNSATGRQRVAGARIEVTVSRQPFTRLAAADACAWVAPAASAACTCVGLHRALVTVLSQRPVSCCCDHTESAPKTLAD